MTLNAVNTLNVLQRQNVRLIVLPGDDAFQILKRTIEELEREKKSLLKDALEHKRENKDEAIEEDRELFSVEMQKKLKSIEPNSIENIIALDKLIDEINFNLAKKQLPSTQTIAEKISKIELRKNNLTRIPEVLIKHLQTYPHLKKLLLSENNLAYLPDSIGCLTTLTMLKLSANKLITLPKNIGQLTALEAFTLRDNQLQTLPSTMNSLINLKFLTLARNKFTWLPSSLEFILTETQASDSDLFNLIGLLDMGIVFSPITPFNPLSNEKDEFLGITFSSSAPLTPRFSQMMASTTRSLRASSASSASSNSSTPARMSTSSDDDNSNLDFSKSVKKPYK